MAGDLQQISLSDIFQTLAMSKMVGVLKVNHPLERRSLFFEDGYVRDVVFGRTENRRLGSRLIGAGFVQPHTIKAALAEQRQSGEPLGQILVANGALADDELNEVVAYQAAEDIYALFTWKSGSFEFFKGPPRDAKTLARLRAVPSFEVNGVLLEVARRSDEWELIVQKIHSVDEVMIQVDGAETDWLEGEVATVFGVLDGARSVRELTNFTTMGLFDCARHTRDLLEWGVIEIARPDEMLAVAEMQRLRGDSRHACVTLRTVIDRQERLDIATTLELAAALERCGEPRIGSRCLSHKAREEEDPDIRLDLAREAYRLDKRSAAVARFLLDSLHEHGIQGEEVIEVTSDLADAHLADGDEEAALQTIEALESTGEDLTTVLSRKARLLQRLDRSADAVASLLDLAGILREQGRRSELVQVYEQVLKLDDRRRDIARALAVLRTSKRTRRLRAAALAVLLLIGVGIGYAWWVERSYVERLTARVERIQAQLDHGEVGQVVELLAAATAEFGARPELDSVELELTRMRAAKAMAEREKERTILRRRLGVAADHLEASRIPQALDIYRELVADDDSAAETRRVAKSRLGTLPARIERLAQSLPALVPEPLRDTDTPGERDAALEQIEREFRPNQLAFAKDVLQAARDELVIESLETEAYTRLVKAGDTVVDAFALAEERATEFRAAAAQAAAEQQLQGVFEQARQHEEQLHFAAALTAYRQLASEYPADNDLRQQFAHQAERCAAIVAHLDQIAAATEAGDAEGALARFEAALAAEPQVPFHSLVQLPLHIDSVPRGATVSIGDRDLGTTPLTTRYTPTGKTAVRVERPGFAPALMEFEGAAEGRLRFDLSRIPDWTVKLPGSVERTPTCSDDAVYVVDRSGTVSALDRASGELRWSYRTEDLSGLHPSPVLCGSQIVVASFDDPGTLHCLDGQSGEVLWQTDDLPCEGAPAFLRGVLVVGTRAGAAVGLHPQEDGTWQEAWRVELPGPVSAGVQANQRHAVVPTATGWLVCLDPRDGGVVWQARIGDRMVASPAVTDQVVVAVSDDGIVAAFAAADGTPRWQREGLGELVLAPTVVDQRVLVAGERTLWAFDLDNGRPGHRFEGDQVLSCSAVQAGSLLWLGTGTGQVVTLDPANLSRQFTVQGAARVSAAPASDGAGGTIVAFEDGTVLGFAAADGQ
ncbi:MAG: PQQ-binding-like beta-propeller repeat protein [Planctomycetota bacterium]